LFTVRERHARANALVPRGFGWLGPQGATAGNGELLDGSARRRGKRGGVMRYEQPDALPEDENVRCLDGGFVEAVRKSGGDMFSAGDPGDFTFDAHPNGTQRDAYALCVGKNARPTAAHLIPTEQKLPAGLDALDGIVMRPHGLHFGDVERFESGIKPLVRGANRFVGGLLLRCCLCGHWLGFRK